ncbi:MAG: hypothetical protein IPJ13_22380 [Saprospiraceae bacterium]|nr:hypothetical protein [Saprospiraceae bacterium]MBP6447146.1 hypothetical protein [Saprospiraceae bacterium]
MTGIGVIIIFLQLFPLLGHVSPKTIPEIIMNLGTPFSAIHWSSLGMTLLTMAIIYLFPRITKNDTQYTCRFDRSHFIIHFPGFGCGSHR